ncbi:ABC transporter ATP-binding protein [Streptomyces sp. ventii]|uniref:ABC transporter ATP-binding protein n=1 Tax=Streptomyces spiramenti TaxID=2720606 RepID=A0ABX1AKZ5_9ACTN|nr:ABC transporter ATP-binding protein [Streptomyces spiramenti]NJP67794.1 ABC transporter ATP-binding protein [Streptomyces spiramenti]
MLPALLRHRPAPALVVLVCDTAGALCALTLPLVLGLTIDRLLGGGAVPWTWIALCTVLVTAETAFDAAVTLLGGVHSARLTSRLRERALERLLRTEPRRAAEFSPGDLTTRLTATATAAAGAPVAAAGALCAVLLPVGGLIGIALTDAWTALAFLLGVPPLVLLLRAFTRDTGAVTAEYQRSQAVVATRLAEAVEGAATVRAAGTARREHARITAPLGELAVHGHRTWRVYGRAVGLSSVLLPVLAALVLAVGGLRLAAGALTVGELVTVSRYAALAMGVGAVTGALGALARSRAAGERLGPVLALPAPGHRGAVLPAGGPGALELTGVDVTRDGRRLLRDVDLAVPGGTSVAVVGLSGSGKSVLAAVAGRLTDPDRGTVALDGVPLRDVPPERLRREVAYAFAAPALFGATVSEAVAFGAGAADPATVREAARAAEADDFVRLLPHGYDTPMDRAPLSGGERQRLGLARAFARPGRLLILDDATSGLDTATERRVQRALDRYEGRRTRLIVAHRASTAARADTVLWLEEGAVRAVGRHERLWRDPSYRAVFHGSAERPPPRPGGNPDGGLAA